MRINVEDKFLADPRFLMAVALIGDRELTIGIAVGIWQAAATFWYPKKKLIPEEVFMNLRGADVWLQVHLARKQNSRCTGVAGIYVAGTQENFAWRFRCSKGGKESARKRLGKTKGVGKGVGKGEPPPILSYPILSNPILSNLKEEYVSTVAEPTGPTTGAINELASPDYDNLISKIKIVTQRNWLKLYPDVEWIRQELLKAQTWLIENSHKAPRKSFGQFMTNWLSRGWEQHRKNIPAQSKDSGETFIQYMKNKGYQ